MDEIAIRLNNVSKYYKLYNLSRDRLKEALNPLNKIYHKKYFALKNIDLEVRKGEILGIVGKNGCGKSTLLKLIAKILVPNNGSVIINGRISALLELGAGFNPDFTGLENIYFYATVHGISKEQIQVKVENILSFADIGEFIHQPLKSYSSGMKARLGFAVATEIDPDILIIDEVLAVGDAMFQRKCYARIESFLQRGKTVLLVSHNRNNIVSLCDNALLLNNGIIHEYGKAEEVMKTYDILVNDKFLSANSAQLKTNTIIEDLGTNEILIDETLVAKPILFQSSKVNFDDFLITTADNKKTNILKTAEKYLVKATFSFEENLSQLTFALRIKNLQGMVVSWIGYPFDKKSYINAQKGEVKTIELSFNCNLLHGTYAIDVGLQSNEKDDIKVHVGYHDIYLFKVNKDSKNHSGISFLNFNSA